MLCAYNENSRSTGTALAQVGIANAFATAGNIASVVNAPNSGSLGTTPAGNGTVPAALVNTMADIVASCVNSTGPASPACSTLLGEALANGTTGAAPTDTASALINIAHNPTANVGDLYDLVAAIPPFLPALTRQPNDFTLALTYTGARLSNFTANFGGGYPVQVSIDGSGNVFTIDPALGPTGINKFSPLGVDLSSNTTFNGNATDQPYQMLIDSGNNVWVLNSLENTSTATRSSTNLEEFSNAGAQLSGPSGYTGGYLTPSSDYSNFWVSMAFNPAGNLMVSTIDGNYTLFNPAGQLVSPQPAYPQLPSPVFYNAYDPAGDLWTTAQSGLNKLLPSGVAASTSPYSGSGLVPSTSVYEGLAVDSAGNVWVPLMNSTSGNSNLLAVFKSDGTPLVAGGIPLPSDGGTPTGVAIDGAGAAYVLSANDPAGPSIVKAALTGTTATTTVLARGFAVFNGGPIILDASGNAWTVDYQATGNTFQNARLVEFVGLSTPVVTPLAAGVAQNALGTRP